MSKTVISTDSAPAAIGPYSRAVRIDDLVFLSGQIALDPETMELVSEDFAEQMRHIFKNPRAVATAAGSLDHLVKVNLYLTDLANFQTVNQVMEEFFAAPYPARAPVGVADLPRGAAVEAEAVMAVLGAG